MFGCGIFVKGEVTVCNTQGDQMVIGPSITLDKDATYG